MKQKNKIIYLQSFIILYFQSIVKPTNKTIILFIMSHKTFILLIKTIVTILTTRTLCAFYTIGTIKTIN